MIVWSFLSFSCCPAVINEPRRPEGTLGWKDDFSGGAHSIGILVLSKGESSDNGTIGVTVVDLLAPDPCAEPGTYNGSPKALLHFFRPSDQKILCDVTLVGDNKNSFLHCDSSIGISTIAVNAINVKEKWVFFDLRE